MATQVSVLYHRWVSQCYRVASFLEHEMAEVLSGNHADLAEVESSLRAAIWLHEDLGEISEQELRRMVVPSLKLAESARELMEAIGLPPEHALRQLQDDLANHAEAIADSVDPELADARESALAELSEGKLISLDSPIHPQAER